MALVTTTQPSLTGGVSQLAASQRLDTQGKAQENAYSTVVSGLHKRHPTEHVANISTQRSIDGAELTREVHFIDRDDSERYVVELAAKDPTKQTLAQLRVHDLLTGRNVKVYAPDPKNNPKSGKPLSADTKNYCRLNSAGDNIKMLTIADYTLILNRDGAEGKATATSWSNPTAMKEAQSTGVAVENMPDAVNVAAYVDKKVEIQSASSRRKIIFVRSGNYATVYALRLTTVDRDGAVRPRGDSSTEEEWTFTRVKTWKGNESTEKGIDEQRRSEGQPRNGSNKDHPWNYTYYQVGAGGGDGALYSGYWVPTISPTDICHELVGGEVRPFKSGTRNSATTTSKDYHLGPYATPKDTLNGYLMSPRKESDGASTLLRPFVAGNFSNIHLTHATRTTVLCRNYSSHYRGGIYWTYNLTRDFIYDTRWRCVAQAKQTPDAFRLFNGSYGWAKAATQNGCCSIELTAVSANDGYNSVKGAGAGQDIYRDSFALDVVEEGTSSGNLIVIGDEIDSIDKLPLTCVHGHRVKVMGDQETGSDDYWVEFVGDPDVLEARKKGAWYRQKQVMEGSWQECSASAELDSFNPATLPHQLVRKSDAKGVWFELGPVDWAKRQAGDNETNPPPTFMGKQIEDIFFHQNRLGFLSGSNVILSEAAEPFNFWRTTVTTVLDSDPIDVNVGHVKVVNLRSAVPYAEKLVIFGDTGQFVMAGEPILTPRTVSVSAAADFEIDPKVEGVSSGEQVYFAYARGGYSGVRELFDSGVQGAEGMLISNDLTGHVPQYLPGRVKELAATSRNNVLVARVDDDPSAIYVYKHHTIGRERAQSAWMRFSLGTESVLTSGHAIGAKASDGEAYTYVQGMHFIDENLYLWMTRRSTHGGAQQHYIERLSFDEPTTDIFPHTPPSTQTASTDPSTTLPGFGADSSTADPTTLGSSTGAYQTLLDRRLTENQCVMTYANGRVVIKLPYLIETDKENGKTYPVSTGSAMVLKHAKMRVISREASVTSGSAVEAGQEYEIAKIAVYTDATIGVPLHQIEIPDPEKTMWVLLGGTLASTADPVSADRKLRLWIGQDYKMSYEFNQPAVKQVQGRQQRDIQTGRIQVLYGTLAHAGAKGFDIDIGPALDAGGDPLYNRDTVTHSYSSKIMKEDAFRFPVYSQSRESRVVLRNDSPFPSRFLSAEWDMTYTRRTALYRG